MTGAYLYELGVVPYGEALAIMQELAAARNQQAIPDTVMLLEHEPLHDWIRSVHETSAWTTSVCTGSLLLAAAGLLDGAPATTHWLARDRLAELGAKPVPDRVVEHGKIVTAAGVSSGIDMALHLVRKINGEQIAQAVQLGIEYDPQPPLDAGAPEKAPPEVVELVTAAFAARESAGVPE